VKNLTDFNAQKMHMQMVGRANFRDVVAYREMLLRRKIFLFLDILAILSVVIGFILYKLNYYNQSYFAFGLAILIITYFFVRKLGKSNKRRDFRKKRNNRRFRHRRR